MAGLVNGLPGSTESQQGLQFAKVIHAQSVEIAPARDAEEVVDDHCGIALAC